MTHLELVHTPEDRLVFCEIASRPGGGGINELVEAAYGVDLMAAAMRLQCGLP